MRQTFRHRLSVQLDPELRGAPGLSGLNRGLVACILVLIVLAILETEAPLVQRFGPLFNGIEWTLFAVFAVEYAARVWTAPLNPRFASGFAYARTPSALIDLAVLLSFLTPILGAQAAVFRLLQLARILRLARLGRYSRAMTLLYDAVRSRGPELALSLVMAFALMLVAATLLYLIEAEAQPEAFGSIPRAMWWAVATLTTVGYGDAIPVTVLGKVMASVTALCGIGIIALPAGVLAGAFSEAIRNARNERSHPDRTHTP